MDHGRSEGSESPEVRKSESPEVGKSGSPEVRKSGSREVRKSESPEVGKSGSREVRKSGSREVGKLGSRDVRKSERPEDKNYSYALHVLSKKLGHPERRERNYTPCFTANACTLSQGVLKMDAFVILIASASTRTGSLIGKKKMAINLCHLSYSRPKTL